MMSYSLAYGIILGGIVVGLVAFALAGWTLREARRDLAWIRRLGIGNGRRLVAMDAVRQEAARLFSIGFIVGALVVIYFGQPPPIDLPVEIRTVVALTLILGGLAIIVLDGIGAMIARRRLDEELRAGHAAATRHTTTRELRSHRRDATVLGPEEDDDGL